MSNASHKSDSTLDRVTAIVKPVCAQHGIDLVSVEWAQSKLLRLTIERVSDTDPHGKQGWGVSLEDCADVSRELSKRLDAAELEGRHVVSEAYQLEVSSPGLERPLLSVADYRRFSGLLCKLKLERATSDGQRVLRGILGAVTGRAAAELVTIEVDGKPREVALGDVASAHLVFEMGGTAKAAKRTKPAAGKKTKSATVKGSKGVAAAKSPAAKSAVSKAPAAKSAVSKSGVVAIPTRGPGAPKPQKSLQKTKNSMSTGVLSDRSASRSGKAKARSKS